ncbi:MAG: M28 family peptidase [bacterium]
MKKLTAIILIVCTITGIHAQSKSGVESISLQEIKQHLEFLASDGMLGRDTPSPELDSCARYIVDEFKSYGCKPIQDNSYFQYFNVTKNSLSEPNMFKLITGNDTINYKIKHDFVPIYLTANRTVTAPVVFAGYGITAPEYNYDDYANIDAEGKIVFIFTNEPQENDSSSVFEGADDTDYSKILTKTLNAINHGAVGVVLVTAPNHLFRRPPNPWPSLLRHQVEDAVPLSLEEKTENKTVAMRVGKKLAETIISSTGKTMKQLQHSLDSTLKPVSQPIPGIKISMQTNLEFDKQPTRNVCGILEGNDPKLKQEYIVIGAHYDHLGARNDTIIFNGADDNASGTVGVLTLAEAFSQQNHKRSLLFCTWAGEEKGLFGSRYYVNSAPLIPLEKTITYINLDMIGRNDSSWVKCSGIHSSPCFAAMIEEYRKKTGLEVDERKDVSRSDHVPFYTKKIPVLGLFTGFHEDYHKPTDTIEKCSMEGMEQICRFVYYITKDLADREKTPLFSEMEKEENGKQVQTMN